MKEARDHDRGRLRTFLIGGVVGASAAIATARRHRRPQPPRPLPGGIAAFEQAPCFDEQVEQGKKR